MTPGEEMPADPFAGDVRAEATAIWSGLVAAWRTGSAAFTAALDALIDRELRVLVTDFAHGLLELGGMLPGEVEGGSAGPLGESLAEWMPYVGALAEAAQRGRAGAARHGRCADPARAEGARALPLAAPAPA